MHLRAQGPGTAAAASHRDADRVEQLMASIFAVENPMPGSAQGGFRGRWHAVPRSPPNAEPSLQVPQLFLPPQPGAPGGAAPHDLALGHPTHAWDTDLKHAGGGAAARATWSVPLARGGGSGGSGGSLGLLERLLSMPSLPWDELLTPRAGGLPHMPTGAFAGGSQGFGLGFPDGLALPGGSGAAAGGCMPGPVVYQGKLLARTAA